MKYVYFGFNILLIILIGVLTFLNPQEVVLSTNSLAKSLTTTKLGGEGLISNNNNINNDTLLTEQETATENNNDNNQELFSTIEFEQKVLENIVPASVISDVLETQVGTMSAYGPDCSGCSGRLAGGFDASGGNIIYHDEQYGDVRIVAGDSSYEFGSIFRIKGSKLGDFYAIVLDRGRDIGIGKRFFFDLLFSSESEASSFGTSYNVTFELIRKGY